jgi:hypothetical protein
MRADEFISEKQKLDEILPLLVGAARGVAAAAGGAARVAGKVGAAATRGVVGAAANSVGKLAASKLGSDPEPVTTNPNAVVGTQTQPNVKTSEIPPKPSTQRPSMTPALQDKAAAAMTNLKPGANLQLPTGTGRVGNFKISKVMGQNVEIENPDKNKNPNEPDKLIYNKDDLMKSMGVK